MATAIKNNGLLNVCHNCDESIQAVVSYSFNTSSKVLTVTDESSFASGDTFGVINLKIADKFGNVATGQIESSSGNKTFDLNALGFNLSEGFNILATVVSAKGNIADVAAYDVYIHLNSGKMKTPVAEGQTPVTITGVTVVPDDTPEIALGGSLQFNASVQPLNAPQGVTWELLDDNSGKLTIDITGKVSVAANADNSTYTVKATSIADTGVNGTADFTVPASYPAL